MLEEPKSMGRHLDREAWPAGAWQVEDDKYEWRHLGYPCMIIRAHHGALCGYVAVRKGHPWYGLSRGKLEEMGIEAHGGITYAAPCQGVICHTPRPGEPRRVWWVGFDCAHLFDLMPAHVVIRSGLKAWIKSKGPDRGVALPPDTYCDLAYVTGEVRRLAEQAEEAAR